MLKTLAKYFILCYYNGVSGVSFERSFMAYYLKKTKMKGRTYLSIDESFYSHQKKGTAHRVYKSLSSVETLKKNGIEDPIAFYQAEVDRLNAERKEAGVPKISEVSPSLYVGYFPLKSIMEKLKIKHYVDYFKLTTDFGYDLYELLAALVYSRSVNPCSKLRTFHEVIPNLYEKYDFSYDQLLDGLSFLGNNYEKFIEIFTVQTNNVYKLDNSKTYFDCTNFYFEIDREDVFRLKGPSKENQKTPIVGLGLLLDANQIPIGMKMYPGNESEKPDVIDNLKKQTMWKEEPFTSQIKALTVPKTSSSPEKTVMDICFPNPSNHFPKPKRYGFSSMKVLKKFGTTAESYYTNTNPVLMNSLIPSPSMEVKKQ